MSTKKKLLQAAAGSAGGAGALNVEDVFSTYLYTGNGDTQVIENGINLGQANSGASIFFPDGDGDYLATASLPQFTGAFTFEFWFYSYDSARAVYLIDKGVRDTNLSIQTNYLTDDHLFVKVAGTSFSYTTAGLDADGWNHIAVVRDSSDNVATFVNGTRRGSPTTASGSVTGGVYYIGSSSAGIAASGYELMYGHMSSVRISDTARYSTSSTSITVPTSEYTSDSNTVLLLGQGDTPLEDASSNSYAITINGGPTASEVGPFTADDAGEGGLVWIKNRVGANSHKLFDTERGALYKLHTDETIASTQETDTLSSFNANGFSVLSDNAVNGSTAELASWTFRKAPKFFDVVTYTGDGTAGRTISHNLGIKPGFIIFKRLDVAEDWITYHSSMTATDFMYFNRTDAAASTSVYFNNTEPTDSVITLGSHRRVNASGSPMIAYVFAHNDGDGEFGPTGNQDIIKCGSFTESGSVQEINLGFEPQWLMIKTSTSTSGWRIFDSMRGFDHFRSGTYSNKLLEANTSSAEGSSSPFFEPTPTGFNVPTGFFGNGVEYVYIAIRRGPMAVPTDAKDVFAIDIAGAQNPSPPIFDSGFPVDFNFYKSITGSDTLIQSRLTGFGNMSLSQSSSESLNNGTYWEKDYNNGMGSNTGSNSNAYMYMWQRRPNFCDVVTYDGNQTAGHNISHNLGVAPEMMWVKKRSGVADWRVYHSGIGATKYLTLNSTAAAATHTTLWNDTAPTDSVFTLGTESSVNESGSEFIAYLFATLDGVSKVGSYTGDGTTDGSNVVDCGFTNGARFIIVKMADGTSNWGLFDTERGIVSGNDPRLFLDTTAAQLTTVDFLVPNSSGFAFINGFNSNGFEYIFYAIA